MKPGMELRTKDGSLFEILNKNEERVRDVLLQKGQTEVTICFYVEPKWRGLGYASEAVGKVTEYAHRELGIKHVHAYLNEGQIPECTANGGTTQSSASPVTAEASQTAAHSTDLSESLEMARHVLEHHGYERVELADGGLMYEHHIEETRSDDTYEAPEGQKVLYLAGGCFWGMEKAFRALHGVTDTVVGYANGTLDHPTYEQVCQYETGYRETIRVTFDPAVVALWTVLKAYFICIDPTQKDGQGNDIGTQYQTGIYYRDASLAKEIEAYLETEKQKYDAFYVECKPLESFWMAEEYHQDYLSKIPDGYCHISTREIAEIRKLNQRKKEEPA